MSWTPAREKQYASMRRRVQRFARQQERAEQARQVRQAKEITMRIGDTVPAVSPGKNWKLVCRSPIRANGRLHDVGCEISADDLGKNFRQLLSNHSVEWVPPHVAVTKTSRDLPVTPPVKSRPKVEIVPDVNPLESWRLTVAHMTKLCDGNAALADDLLLRSKEGSELFRQCAVMQQRAKEAVSQLPGRGHGESPELKPNQKSRDCHGEVQVR